MLRIHVFSIFVIKTPLTRAPLRPLNHEDTDIRTLLLKQPMKTLLIQWSLFYGYIIYCI